jgi:hypothetical protein
MNRRFYLSTAGLAIAVMALIWFSGGEKSSSPAGNSGGSASPANSSPNVQASGSVLPAEYSLLQTRSPFGRGSAQGPGAGHGGPEATFIFRGAVQTGSSITAFIEDANAKNVVQMAAGQSLARGRIKSIDLDAIEYESGGNTRRIEAGQNLNGEVVQPPPTTAPSPAGSPPPPSPPQNGNMPPNMQMQMQMQQGQG